MVGDKNMAEKENKLDLANLSADQIKQLRELLGIGDINVNIKSKKKKVMKTGQPQFLAELNSKTPGEIIKIEGYPYIYKGKSMLIPRWGKIALKDQYKDSNGNVLRSWYKSSFSAWKSAVAFLNGVKI